MITVLTMFLIWWSKSLVGLKSLCLPLFWFRHRCCWWSFPFLDFHLTVLLHFCPSLLSFSTYITRIDWNNEQIWIHVMVLSHVYWVKRLMDFCKVELAIRLTADSTSVSNKWRGNVTCQDFACRSWGYCIKISPQFKKPKPSCFSITTTPASS